jgi:hypothetical protein
MYCKMSYTYHSKQYSYCAKSIFGYELEANEVNSLKQQMSPALLR